MIVLLRVKGYLLRALDPVLRVAVVPVQHVPPVPPHLRHPRRIPPAVAVPPPHPLPEQVSQGLGAY